MKYKPGDKFIIEIEKPIDDGSVYSIKGGACMLTEYILDNLKPYPRGIEVKENAEYQRGLADAWEAALKILTMRDRDRGEVFGGLIAEIFSKNTAAEAIEKIREYEEEKEIKVGDEITDGELKAIALELRDGYIHYLLADGTVSYYYLEANVWKKTGRHFTEVDALLDKMKEGAPDV